MLFISELKFKQMY